MVKLELVYMNLRARGETIAMLLHHGGVDFKDTRIPWDEMAEYKAASPSGQFPIMLVEKDNGEKETFVESGALIRYAGSLAGVNPTDPLDMLQQDQVVEIVQCIAECNPLMNYFDCEADGFQERFDTYFSGKAEPKLKQLETLLASKKDSVYFGGDKPLVGDFHAWFLCDMVETLKPGTLAAYPTLEAMFKKLLIDSKGLVNYLKERPKCSEVGVPGQKNLGRKLNGNSYYLELEK